MTLGLRGAFNHASWQAAIGTAVSYAVILLAMFFFVFVVPFIVFLVF